MWFRFSQSYTSARYNLPTYIKQSSNRVTYREIPSRITQCLGAPITRAFAKFRYKSADLFTMDSFGDQEPQGGIGTRENGGVEVERWVTLRVTWTGLRDCARSSRYYIRRTCTGEIKDNAKKKIQRRIAREAAGRKKKRGKEMNV